VWLAGQGQQEQEQHGHQDNVPLHCGDSGQLVTQLGTPAL